MKQVLEWLIPLVVFLISAIGIASHFHLLALPKYSNDFIMGIIFSLSSFYAIYVNRALRKEGPLAIRAIFVIIMLASIFFLASAVLEIS